LSPKAPPAAESIFRLFEEIGRAFGNGLLDNVDCGFHGHLSAFAVMTSLAC
jgi:hypothetical protein